MYIQVPGLSGLTRSLQRVSESHTFLWGSPGAESIVGQVFVGLPVIPDCEQVRGAAPPAASLPLHRSLL